MRGRWLNTLKVLTTQCQQCKTCSHRQRAVAESALDFYANTLYTVIPKLHMIVHTALKHLDCVNIQENVSINNINIHENLPH